MQGGGFDIEDENVMGRGVTFVHIKLPLDPRYVVDSE